MSFPDKEGVVYRLTFPDGKCYIGVTTIGLHKRLINHASAALTADTKVIGAIKKFGMESVKAEVIDQFINKEQAAELERKYIKENNSRDNGYNTAFGGNGAFGSYPDEESRIKMSASQKSRFIDPKEKEKISIGQRLWIQNNPDRHIENVKKRKEIMSTTEYREKASTVSKQFHSERPEIGENHSAFMKQRYKDNPEQRLRVSRQKGGTPIEVFKDGKSVGVYDMIKDFAVEQNLSTGNIAMVLKGVRAHTKGFTFKRVVNEKDINTSNDSDALNS